MKIILTKEEKETIKEIVKNYGLDGLPCDCLTSCKVCKYYYFCNYFFNFELIDKRHRAWVAKRLLKAMIQNNEETQ